MHLEDIFIKKHWLKGIVHPKMECLSSFTHPLVVGTQKKIFLKNVDKQFWFPLTSTVFFAHTVDVNANRNYKDNDISVHTSGRYCLFILSGTLVCRFKFSSSLYQDWCWLGVNVCIIHQLEKNRSESDSNDIVSLCLYHYSCGVESAIL